MKYLSYSNFKPFYRVKYIFMKCEDWDVKPKADKQDSGISKSESGAVRIDHYFLTHQQLSLCAASELL